MLVFWLAKKLQYFDEPWSGSFKNSFLTGVLKKKSSISSNRRAQSAKVKSVTEFQAL